MKVKGVVFDMGGTLIRFYPPYGAWEDMEKAGGTGINSISETC